MTANVFHKSICSVFLAVLYAGSVYALEITDVRVTKSTFDPAKDEITRIRFNLSQEANAEILISDGRDLLVRRIAAASVLPAGESSLTWDGLDEKGHTVPPEAYHYVITAQAIDGREQTYDLTDRSGLKTITAREVLWDKESNQIRYRLPSPARVSIRIGLKNYGPLLDTVVKRVPRPAGINEEYWDGWDSSNALDLSDHPNLNIAIDAYSLSDNTLLVGPPPEHSNFVVLSENEKQKRKVENNGSQKLANYGHQPLEESGDVKISLSLLEEYPEDENGLPVISGIVPIQLDVLPQDRNRVIEKRFEPVFYIDGVFAFENEVGYLPFTWLWDTRQVNEGIHYVSGNLLGYTGNFGMATIKVRVKRSGD